MSQQTAKPGPSSDLIPIEKSLDDTLSCIAWGMTGTGKTLFFLRDWPLPILVLNLDRSLTSAHLFDPATGKPFTAERKAGIFTKNLREGIRNVEHLDALQIKNGIDDTLQKNLEWLKGGTLLLDGGTMYRSILKMADQRIAKAIAEGKRWNPKEKEHINAYLGAFISHVVDQGINLAITAHAAWSWEYKEGDSGTKSLQKTHNLYPKFDDIGFERTTVSLLLFTRCGCGRNILNQDGTCVAAGMPNTGKHEGRKHAARVVSNKYASQTEGLEFPNLNYKTLKTLCFDREGREALIASKSK